MTRCNRFLRPFPRFGVCASLLILALAIGTPIPALAGVPTAGQTTDLKGRASDYANVLIDGAPGTGRNTLLFCNGTTATRFASRIHFTLGGSTPAPAGSYFRVY